MEDATMDNKICVDAKTIIVNLLKEDQKDYLSIERLQRLLEFIYSELSRQSKLDEYQISFDINFYSIERTVQYNSDIFVLDIDGEHLWLRKRELVDVLAERYQVDSTITAIIREFHAHNVA